MRRRRNTYSCGGPGSYEGSCGASDCQTCHPEWQGEGTEEDDDARREDAMMDARERGRERKP